MNDLHDKELSALFANDRGSDALVDEAFVARCVTSFRRAERWRLVLRLSILGGAAACAALALPVLAGLAAAVPGYLAAIVPGSFASAWSALDNAIGGIDRAVAVVVVLIVLVRQYRHRGQPQNGPN